MAANRERRSGAGKRAFDSSVFDRLKDVRAGTLSRAQQLQLKDEGDVYDEMDEKEYQQYVKERKERDASWIEDDIGGFDEDDDWDGTEEGRKQSISRVNMPQRGGRVGAAMPMDDRVSSILLGAGKQVGPGTVRTNTHTDDAQPQRAWTHDHTSM